MTQSVPRANGGSPSTPAMLESSPTDLSRCRPELIGALIVLVLTLVLLTGCGTAVPEVVGMTQVEASETIAAAGFFMGTVSYDGQQTDDAGVVVSQSPASNTKQKAKTPIALVLSGKPPVAVPALAGMSANEASSALQAAGLAVGQSLRVYDETVAAGKVISQEPSAGVEVQPATAVALTLSKGKTPVAIPSVKGKSEKSAKSALEAAGFKVKVKTKNSSKKKGTVIAQKPSGGKAQPATTVVITVSKGVQLVTVPNIIGMIDPDPVLRRAGLVPRGIDIHGPIESDALGMGEAYRQRPAAGSRVPKGTVVTYHSWWESQ